jgi:hypoxanthine phosphoribosyltransferase
MSYTNHPLIKPLFTESQIESRLIEIAHELDKDYVDKQNILCVGLLSGAIMTVTHLLKKVHFDYELDFISVSSYGNETESSGSIKLKKDLSKSPNGYHVIVIEDLIDTGYTLDWVTRHIVGKGCESIKIMCLLDKKERRRGDVNVKVDYIGFECPDEFVVGYGMDFQGKYRCLPYVGVLQQEQL